MHRHLTCCLSVLSLLLLSRPASAHFPWLAVDQDGKAAYFFGEHPADRTYHMPEPIGKAVIRTIGADGRAKTVKMTGVETDDFVGRQSAGSVARDATLVSQVTYGLYQGSRLDYYTIYQGGRLPTSLAAYKSKKSPLALTARLVDTDGGVDVYVLWQGSPLSGAKVSLYCDEGHTEGEGETDAQGKVSFNDREVEDGLNGIMVGHTVNQGGELNGQSYKSSSHYLTVTFIDPQTAADQP